MKIKQCWNHQRSGKAALGFAVLAVFGFTAQAQAQSSTLSIDSGAVTYADHVAEIITENCVVCHREGGIGPMKLENYEQEQFKNSKIKQRSRSRNKRKKQGFRSSN